MKPETVKDRARRAYLDQQTQDSEGGCGQPIGFIYGFIAGEESAQSRINELESDLVDMAKALGINIKKIDEDYWFMINLIEKYSSDKGSTLKDVLERLKFRRPLLKKCQELLSEIKKDGK
jgi:hypothetical protein